MRRQLLAQLPGLLAMRSELGTHRLGLLALGRHSRSEAIRVGPCRLDLLNQRRLCHPKLLVCDAQLLVCELQLGVRRAAPL